MMLGYQASDSEAAYYYFFLGFFFNPTTDPISGNATTLNEKKRGDGLTGDRGDEW